MGAVRLGLADLPAGATRLQCYGVALLCGIGFTMSLFIGALAFPDRPELSDATKIGVLLGSALSALAGYLAAQRRAAGEASAARASEHVVDGSVGREATRRPAADCRRRRSGRWTASPSADGAASVRRA